MLSQETEQNKYYWKIYRTFEEGFESYSYGIYTMLYDPSESYADFVKRLWKKAKLDSHPISSVKLHYHGENKRPIYLEDAEDYIIYLMVQDFSNPKKGFTIYTGNHFHCYETLSIDNIYGGGFK